MSIICPSRDLDHVILPIAGRSTKQANMYGLNAGHEQFRTAIYRLIHVCAPFQVDINNSVGLYM